MTKEQKLLRAEQQDLSILMLQLLVKIYDKKSLEIERDGNTVSVWTVNDNKHLYDMWGEPIEGKQKYWIRVQNGSGLVTFGRMSNDGTCFNDGGLYMWPVVFSERMWIQRRCFSSGKTSM